MKIYSSHRGNNYTLLDFIGKDIWVKVWYPNQSWQRKPSAVTTIYVRIVSYNPSTKQVTANWTYADHIDLYYEYEGCSDDLINKIMEDTITCSLDPEDDRYIEILQPIETYGTEELIEMLKYERKEEYPYFEE